MSDVVDQALELYRRQRMFAQANAAYAALRADPDVSAEWDAESVLSEILDQVMVSAGGLQTLLARWNWSSYYSHGAQSTPYELACGVHGQCTTGQSWCALLARRRGHALARIRAERPPRHGCA